MKKSSALSTCAALCALGLSACDLFSGSGSAESFLETDSTAAQVLHDIPVKVVYPTYQDLAAKAALLQTAVTSLSNSKTDGNLLAAQNAWRATRKPWEQSEAFLFGPVETQGIDPHIDSWPLDKTQLDQVLASNAVLTRSYIDNLDESLKGFHTIEYLLFDTNATKQASQVTARQLEYLTALIASFKASADMLEYSWRTTGGNYIGTFQTAGAGSAIYTSRSSAVQELLNGMSAICNEVANGKISEPFDQKNRKLEESQFSNNSDSDFSDNIRSVRNLYLGAYGSQSGTGLKHLVQQKDALLAARVEAEADSAIAAILAMKPNFGAAIFSAPTKVEAARGAVQTLQATLDGPVKKVLGL